ncbi:hypothetical protein [Tenacibaculum aiptasiae]|uniref:hypothetical protein n=1 Tax=Tenacibaculum aiptasiae TaxID=426481 RepID=UPI003B5B4A91
MKLYPYNKHLIKTSLLIVLSATLLSCNKKKKQISKKWKNPIIIDSLPIAKKFFDTKNTSLPYNQLIFIGTNEDSIWIAQKNINPNYEFGSLKKANNKHTEIEIIPDTTQNLSIDIEQFSFPPPPVFISQNNPDIDKHLSDSILDVWKNRPRKYVKAYPIFIRNKSKDTIKIEHQDGAIILIQEAKNKQGNWKPIEKWLYSFCGNSYGDYYLGKNDILVIKKAHYQGSFKTDIRLKIKTNNKIIYSKPFKGSINPEQFN